MSYQITRKRINRGLQLFTVLSLSSLVLIFFLTRSHVTAVAFEDIEPLWILVALPFIALDWVAGGYRLFIFSRVFHPQIRFKTCVKANLANYFLGSITPAQTGGGPAQIYMLWVGGMPVVEATSASLMAFFSTTGFLILAAAGTFLFKGTVPLEGRLLGHLYTIGIFFFLAISVLMVVAVAFPGFYRELTKIVVRVASRIRGKDYLRPGSKAHEMIDAIDRCHEQLIHYLQKQWPLFIFGIIVSGVCFLSKFSVAYFIVRSFGIEATFVHVALLQMVITLINYFFPSPGASGAAELSSAALMSAIVPKGLIPFYVIIWRLLSTYVSVAVGGMVVLHELGKKERFEIDEGSPAEPVEPKAAETE